MSKTSHDTAATLKDRAIVPGTPPGVRSAIVLAYRHGGPSAARRAVQRHRQRLGPARVELWREVLGLLARDGKRLAGKG